MLVCPKCGKNSDESEFFEAFCISCYHFSFRLPKGYVVERCNRCGRMRLLGEWQQYNHRKIEAHIESKCRGDYKSCVYSLESRVFSFEFVKGENKITLKQDWEPETRNAICEDCSRLSSGYFEAIIQIRGAHVNVQSKAKKLLAALQKKTFIPRMEDMHGGLDIYAGSSKAVSAVLAESGLKPAVSRKLFGRKEGKLIYRTTYAIRV